MLSFELTEEEKLARCDFITQCGKQELDSSFQIEYVLSADEGSVSCVIRNRNKSKLIAVRSL